MERNHIYILGFPSNPPPALRKTSGQTVVWIIFPVCSFPLRIYTNMERAVLLCQIRAGADWAMHCMGSGRAERTGEHCVASDLLLSHSTHSHRLPFPARAWGKIRAEQCKHWEQRTPPFLRCSAPSSWGKPGAKHQRSHTQLPLLLPVAPDA